MNCSKIVTVLCSMLFASTLFAAKPYNALYVNNVDLKKYPETIDTFAPGMEVTIGDLHGNALKLIYFLLRNQVIKLSKRDYQQLVTIYTTPPELITSKDLDLFQAIITSAPLSRLHKIRFLGDDLCDRGMNDFYTLFIFKTLDAGMVPFDIVLSNHGEFFLSAFERPEQSFNYNPYGEGNNEATVRSMLNLGKLIDRGFVNKQDIIEWVQVHYLKHLLLPGFLINTEQKEMTIFSHAPLDLAILAALAKDLSVPFNDSDLTELGKSFEGINKVVNQWIQSNKFTEHYLALDALHESKGTPSPLRQVLWNRNYGILDRSSERDDKPYSVNYVHGHDSLPNVFNLDNLFGKGPKHYQGPYAVHVTHG